MLLSPNPWQTGQILFDSLPVSLMVLNFVPLQTLQALCSYQSVTRITSPIISDLFLLAWGSRLHNHRVRPRMTSCCSFLSPPYNHLQTLRLNPCLIPTIPAASKTSALPVRSFLRDRSEVSQAFPYLSATVKSFIVDQDFEIVCQVHCLFLCMN